MMNKLLDEVSEFLAARRGLLPLLGLVLVILSGILQIFSPESWLAERNLFLHLGVIIAILGFLLAWAL